jgi:protein-S-isoprenylcysteine O-methyltransferase Ste14
MSVGLGIFLSSLVLSIVVLYGFTKDRWNWPKIARRTGLGVLTVAALVIGIWAGIYFWNQLPASLRTQTEYAGLRIGMAQDEVMYIKGKRICRY